MPVSDSTGDSLYRVDLLLPAKLEGGFKSLGYVQEARTMLYEWGPTFHLSAYDTLFWQCRRRATAA